MIDTINLLVKDKKLKVDSLLDFKNMQMKGLAIYKPDDETASENGFVLTVCQRTKKLKSEYNNDGEYKVKVIEDRRQNCQPGIIVECSVPKVLYGSNLYEVELTAKNYNIFLNKLFICLKDDVTDLTIEDLKEALIRRVDFGKNIPLTNNSFDLNLFISTVSTYSLNKTYRLNTKTFSRGKRKGLSCAFYNNLHSIKFYNKIEQMLNLKNPIKEERKLVNEFKRNININVLRIERSLQRFQSVQEILPKYTTIKSHYTLIDIWSQELAQKCILELVEPLIRQNLNQFNSYLSSDDPTLIRELLQRFNLNEAGRVFIIKKLSNQIGSKATINLLEEYVSKYTVKYNIRKLNELENLFETLKPSTVAHVWNEVIRQLREIDLVNSENIKEVLAL